MRQRHQLSKPTDAVQLTMALGLGREGATMVVPFLWFTPSGTDAMSPAIIVLVRALQANLSEMGFATRKDGLFDSMTSAAISQVAGPEWRLKSWIQIAGDVLTARQQGRRAMSYTNGARSAMGDVGQAGYCSTSNPQGNCKPISGICLPMDSASLASFKSLQREMNKALKANGRSLVSVDGRIGPQTLSSYKWIANKYGMPGGDFSSCDEMAPVADALIVELYAVTRSLPTVPDPSGSKPSVVAPGGGITHPPGIGKAGFVEFFTTPVGLAMVGAGVFLFLMNRDKKKKPAAKKKKKPRAKRRLPRTRITRTFY